jgi:hypothetical protein
MNGTHQFLVCADYVNEVENSINTTRKNTEAVNTRC